MLGDTGEFTLMGKGQTAVEGKYQKSSSNGRRGKHDWYDKSAKQTEVVSGHGRYSSKYRAFFSFFFPPTIVACYCKPP